MPTLLLSKFTRQHVKVALAGDGGDELFAGYDPFLAHRPAALFARVPRPLRSLLSAVVARLPASSRNMSLDFRLKQFLRGVDAPAGLRHASWLAAFLPREIRGGGAARAPRRRRGRIRTTSPAAATASTTRSATT